MDKFNNSLNEVLVPDNIIKKLILLYGFNFELQKKTNLLFNQLKEPLFENYYIINSDWINKFKDFYNYKEILKLFIENQNFQYHTYKDFEINIDNTTMIIKNLGINQKGHNFTNEVNEKFSFLTLKINTDINSLTYFSNFYIVNETIIDELLLEKGDNPVIKNISNYKFCISKYSFFYYNNEFEIGIINKEGVFAPLYHIRLVNENINPEDEIRTIIKYIYLEKYFEYRKINKKEIVNIIKDSNFGNIGTILNILKYREKKIKEQELNNQLNQPQFINNQNISNLYNNNNKYDNNENNSIQLPNGQIVKLNEYLQTNELLKNNNVITDIKKHNQRGTIYQDTNLENTSSIFSQKSNKQSFNKYPNNINS